MSKTFETAEEAKMMLYEIDIQLHRMPRNRDLRKLYHNIAAMIEHLSVLEVFKRRTLPRSRYHIEFNQCHKEIHTAINYLKNLVLLAKLMQ